MDAATAPLIEFDGVSVTLGGAPILTAVDLRIDAGDFVCIVGPSGCGKTTLLRMLGGLLEPTSGDVRYAGKTVTGPRSDVAVMFQDYGRALLPRVLLMDEPFGALDAMTRQTLQDEMLSIVAATGATVFFVTHDLEEAVYLGNRVIGMLPHPGRIATDVTVSLARPRNQLTTREEPEFARLRRQLFDFIKDAEA